MWALVIFTIATTGPAASTVTSLLSPRSIFASSPNDNLSR